MKLVIPFFQSKFDALQVSYNMFGEIPSSGDFGDFWWLLWLLTPKKLVIMDSSQFHTFDLGHDLKKRFLP